MKLKTIETYAFNELSDDAKGNARQWVLSSGYAWTDESMASIDAFCNLFGVKTTQYELGTYGRSFIDTDATSSNFRGFTLKQARALPEYPTGYCLDETLRLEFIKEFERTGDAKVAFDHAIHAAVKDIISDWEAQESDEYLTEHCEANDYQFDQHGHIV